MPPSSQVLERPELPDGVEPTPAAPPWKPGGVLLAFAIGIAITLGGAITVSIVAVAFGADSGNLPSGVNIILTLVQDGAFVGAALYVASTVARPRPWQFGLRGTNWAAFLGWMVLAFAVLGLFSAVWSQLVDIGKQEDLPDELGVDGGLVPLLAAAFLVTVIAPLAEEFFFRGFVFGSLRSWKGPWVGAVITGVIFGAIHLGSAPSALYLPILAVFGFLLCLLYWKTGSLYPCIVLHAINNCIAFGGTQDGWDWQYAALLAGSLGLIGLFALLVGARSGPAPALVRPTFR